MKKLLFSSRLIIILSFISFFNFPVFMANEFNQHIPQEIDNSEYQIFLPII